MDLRKLRYFVAVAETGSLSKAAEKLAIAQPALTVQIAALEGELSARLFDRGPRGVRLTRDGEQLLVHAMGILRSVNIAIADLRSGCGRIGGHVSVGMPGTVSGVVALDLVRRAREAFPDVLLRIVENTNHVLIQQVESAQIDIALVLDRLEHPCLSVTPVAFDSFVLLGSAALCGTGGGAEATVGWSDLGGLPLLLTSPGSLSRQLVDRAARAAGVSLFPRAEIDATHLLKSAAASGLGFALLPRSACCEAERGAFRTRRIVGPELRVPIAVLTSAVRVVSRAHQAVRDLIVDQCRTLVATGVWEGGRGHDHP